MALQEQEGEFGFLKWLLRRIPPSPRVLIGPGHDAAVVRLADDRVVCHVDNTVEGVHYARGTPWRAVGWKALARCASDIAAMGCRPTAALVGAVLPRRLGRADRRALMEGILTAGRAFDIAIVGGDLTAGPGPAVLSVTVLGEVPKGCSPILRSGARIGDLIAATGRLGGSILGRHLNIRPRIREALSLQKARMLHAMIDVSDGLAADLGHILDESGVGVRLYADRIPIHPDAVRLAQRTGRAPLDHALSDGEDHELVFAFPARQAARLSALARRIACPLTVIGEIARSRRILIDSKGRSDPFPVGGFEHRW